ncbi:MAG: site-2 protease family protein [Nitrospirota bacterium]
MNGKPTVIHIVLFIATLFTTLLAGALNAGVDPFADIRQISKGIPFSFTLLGILLTHEFGHFIASRLHGVSVTLPYFIPAPPFPIGTFGALIKMRPPIRDKRALLDIGAAGPLSGFVVATAAVAIGLSLSRLEPAGMAKEGGLSLGTSIIFSLLTRVVLGINAEDYDIYLHPVAFAGWIGLFVTSMNLIPVGQLDGGHIVYAALGRWHGIVSRLMIPLLIILGIFAWQGWLLWGVLLLLIGTKHPPLLYPIIPLDNRRKGIGWLSFIVFIITFSPVPIAVIS